MEYTCTIVGGCAIQFVLTYLKNPAGMNPVMRLETEGEEERRECLENQALTGMIRG